MLLNFIKKKEPPLSKSLKKIKRMLVSKDPLEKGFMSRIKSCSIIKGMPRIYSPRLEFAWKNQKHDPADVGDWYEDWRIIYYLTDLEDHVDGEIEVEYCKTLEKLELAAITQKIIAPFQ